MAALNLSSNNQNREVYDLMQNDDQYNAWEEIIDFLDELDEGYEQVFLNIEKRADSFDTRKVSVAYPSFIDSFFTGPINY